MDRLPAGRTDSWCYWCGDGYFHGGYFTVCLSLLPALVLYVVVEELIPESQSGGEHESADLSTIGFIIGFAIMMILDVALG